MTELYHWRFHEDLTVIQAAWLIIGCDPSDWTNEALGDLPSFLKQDITPKAFYAHFSALKQAVMNGKISGTVIHYKSTPNYQARVEQSISGNKYLISKEPDWDTTTVPVKELKVWLLRIGYKAAFFFDEQENEQQPLPVYNDEQHHISKDLAILNNAAHKFWANADKNDKDTHPKQEVVREWLLSQGFSGESATQGAVIIRPKWAAIGRRPKE